MANGLRLKFYPALVVLLGIGLAVWLLSRLEIRISVGSDVPLSPIPDSPELPRSPNPSPYLSPSAAGPATAPAPSSPSISPAIAPAPVPLPAGVNQGKLRVSNPSNHLVRVALLPQQPSTDPKTLGYGQPVHWDFAPGEGGTNGLLLSLPDGDLQLQTGDVLMAFTQDGSQRYWGPYVLGKTPAPAWDAATKEWQLVLQP